MSLQTSIGAIGNLLDERARVLPAGGAAHAGADPRRARAAARHRALGFQRRHAAGHLPDSRGGRRAGRGRSTRCAAPPRGRRGTATRSWFCPTATSTPTTRRSPPCWPPRRCTRTLCARAPARMCGLVVESGEPRETMHVALLLGYGAAAVCPYLALETCCEPATASRAMSRRSADGPAQDLLEDGHLDHPELSRRADLRGRRARAEADRPVLPRHRVARRRDRAWPTRTRPPRAGTRPRLRRAAGDRRRRRVPLPRRRRVPPLESADTIVALQRAVRDGSRDGFRALLPSSSTAPAASDAARPARAGAAGGRVPLDEVEPATDDRAALRHRRHEPRLALAARPTRRSRSR